VTDLHPFGGMRTDSTSFDPDPTLIRPSSDPDPTLIRPSSDPHPTLGADKMGQ
jgi:hypothetical protein